MAGLALEPWQAALLDEVRAGRLATVTPAGAPHLVPVCFAFTGGRFAIAIDEKPKRSVRLARLANIAHEPRVCLLVDRYDDDWERLAWLRVDGLATELERGDAWPAALTGLRARYPQYRGMALESRPLIAIEPLGVAGWRAQAR